MIKLVTDPKILLVLGSFIVIVATFMIYRQQEKYENALKDKTDEIKTLTEQSHGLIQNIESMASQNTELSKRLESISLSNLQASLEAIYNITGGDSTLFVSRLGIENGMIVKCIINYCGRYQIYDCSIEIEDATASNANSGAQKSSNIIKNTEVQKISDIISGKMVILNLTRPFRLRIGSRQDFNIIFKARNGVTFQNFCVIESKGKYIQSGKAYRLTDDKTDVIFDMQDDKIAIFCRQTVNH